MTDIASMGGPFVLLLLLTFGAVLGVLGIFLLIWAKGNPRIYGTGFLLVGIVVLVALLVAIQRGTLLPGVNIVMDVLLPGIIYVLAIAIGAVLAVVPFLLAAVRS